MTTQKFICPVCEEGQLTESRFSDDFKHNGNSINVDGLECYECSSCGADPVFEDQIRRNHLRVADAKRINDGLLIGEEIKSYRERLNLSQSQAALLFGGGANAFSKYERGDVLQSKPMDKLLRLVVRYPFLLADMCREAGLSHKVLDKYPANYTEGVKLKFDENNKGSASIKNGKVIHLATWKKTKVAA